MDVNIIVLRSEGRNWSNDWL